MVPAGRRSGKTEISKRKLVVTLLDCLQNPRSWPNPRFFAGAPTREQAKKIWWHDLKKLIPNEWKQSTYETELSITTKWGAELHVIGLDKPERMEGTPWDGGILDEFASTKPGIFDRNIFPALTDREGWCWFIGVPDMDAANQVWYADRVQYALSGQDPEWACFSWPSADIQPPKVIEDARKTMDPRVFEQEFLGKFVLSGGKAFPDFDSHHITNVPYDPSLPLCWALDFNIDPMCSLILQHNKGDIRVIKEFALPDTKTDSACDAFLAHCKQAGYCMNQVYIYGDSTGNARDSTSGISDWAIVRNALKHLNPIMRVPLSNPQIKDTINALNARIKNAEGKASIHLDRSCHRLATDLRSALWPSDLEPQHCLAALRYFVNVEYPIRVDTKPHLGGVGFSGGGVAIKAPSWF